MDTGLIPFYAFILLNAYNNLNGSIDNADRWTSFFTSLQALDDLILVAVIAAGTLAGLHFISIGFDLYLIIMFRKIARLPPDMNPLEDNLTSRRSRSARHKHKNSEMTLTGDEMSEHKRQAHLSGSTLSVSNQSRSSLVKGPEERVMPFVHSRMGSDISFSPHNPDSARYSRQQIDEVSIYQDARSARNSRQDLSSGNHSRAGSVSPAKRGSFIEGSAVMPASQIARLQSLHPESQLLDGAARSDGRFTPVLPNAAPSSTQTRSQQKDALLSDNWYVLDDDAISDMGSPERRRTPGPTFEPIKPAPIEHDRRNSFNPQPLAMNPPTPPPATEEYEDPEDEEHDAHIRQHSRYEPVEKSVTRSGTVLSNSSSQYSDVAESLMHSATPKVKYYGDLASATRGVRGMNQSGLPTPQASRSPSPPKKRDGRVVSRTGVDIADTSTVFLSEQQYGLKGRRQVSGKVAEEGRGWEMWNR